ncbi:MAG: hypothetical protein KA292_08040, partial [Sphingorhabdus sp.]|nr:hypothetical protein [Sphingorhabdus sp.]
PLYKSSVPSIAPSKAQIAEILTLNMEHFAGGRPDARIDTSAQDFAATLDLLEVTATSLR